MLETLKDLERDVEKFHEQVLASNELIYLLRRVIGQTEALNESFDKSSEELLSSLGTIPETLEEKNREHGEAIHEDINGALASAVDSFKLSQDEYLQAISAARDEYLEAVRAAQEEMNGSLKELADTKDAVKAEYDLFEEKCGELPAVLEEKNKTSAETVQDTVNSCVEKLTDTVNSGMTTAVDAFQEEQEKFLQSVELRQNQLEASRKELDEKYNTLLRRLEDVTNTEIPGIKEEFRKKLNSQTIILVIMAIITIAASLNRFIIP